MIRSLRFLALVAVISVATSGCTRFGATSDAGALHPWTKPDTVRIGFYEEPDTLDPAIASMSFSTDVFELIFDGLIRLDDRGRPIPDLAREVPTLANGGISTDGRLITYHLMPKAMWHDGVPVTARDVIYTWQQIMNPKNNVASRTGYDRIVAIDAPDPHTVRVHFRKAYPPAIFLFTNGAEGSILPEHKLRGSASLNRVAFNAAPLGSGPYVFDRWEHGNQMRFHANHAFFRSVPKIEHVVIKFIPDTNTMLSQLRTHEIDLYFTFPPLQVSQIAAMPGIVLHSVSSLGWEHLTFNTLRPPLDQRDVRLALVHAVNETAIFEKIYHGLGRKGPTHFNPDFGWGIPTLEYYPYDLDRASALLDSAGWKRGAGGMRFKNGVPLAFSISTVSGVKAREQIEVFLQSAWHALGADVTVKNYPAATLFAPAAVGGILQSGKTDVALFTWANQTPDPDDETYIAPDQFPPNGQNDSFYKNPEIAGLEKSALATYDTKIRERSYARIARILYDDVPEYVLNWLPELTASNVDLRGVRPEPAGSDMWNIAEWSFR